MVVRRTAQQGQRLVDAGSPPRPVPAAPRVVPGVPAPAHYRALLPRLQRQVGNRAATTLLRAGTPGTPAAPTAQRSIGFEYELDSIRTRHTNSYAWNPRKNWVDHNAGEHMMARTGYDITADVGTGYSRLEFVTHVFDEQTGIPQLMGVLNDIVADIAAIKQVSMANRVGYGAGNALVRGGRTGWFPGDGWVGLDAIPRLKGDWRQQVDYAATGAMMLVGKLQMTAGFTLEGLQRLMSGAAVGNPLRWRGRWQADARQYVTAYARLDAPPNLYGSAVTELVNAGVAGPSSKTVRNLAGVLAAMAQPPIAWRNGTHEGGQVLAKTDYAKIISLVAARTTTPIQPANLLTALLAVVNAYLPPGTAPVTAADPVSNQQLPGVDLTRVTFQQWVQNVVPQASAAPPARDLMAGPNYPGTPAERQALRAYGPYGNRTDPGDKVIFELRDLINSPVTDLKKLANVLVRLMTVINKPQPRLPVDLS